MIKFRLKTTVLASLGLAATLLMAGGCSSEEVVDPNAASGDKTVRIGITRASATTRTGAGASDAVGTSPLEIGSGGYLLFVSNGGVITKSIKVIPGDAAGDDLENGTVSIETLEAGVTIPEVPEVTDKVYIYLNLPSTTISAITAGGNLVGKRFDTTIGSKVLTAAELTTGGATNYSGSFGVTHVPVSGTAALLENGYISDVRAYTATVDLYAMAARIEIPNIQIVGSDITGRYPKEYVLEAILINNYFEEGTLSGDFSINSFIHNGEDKEPYREDHTSFVYKNSKAAYLYTGGGLAGGTGSALLPIGDDGDHTALTKYADPNEIDMVWGYNLFPNNRQSSIAQANYLPHIIVHISSITHYADDVFTTDEKIDVDKWLTVTGYRNSTGLLANFEGGYVYKIQSKADPNDPTSLPTDGLIISIDDLTDGPEDNASTDISVDVTATLYDWVTENVEPVY
jgi:hypothetical protein